MARLGAHAVTSPSDLPTRTHTLAHRMITIPCNELAGQEIAFQRIMLNKVSPEVWQVQVFDLFSVQKGIFRSAM